MQSTETTFVGLELASQLINHHASIFLGVIIAFDKGERLHSAVAFENFGAFIDTDLAPPKNSSGAKLFRENDVIFIGHVLNLVLRLSLFCLLNEVAMCFVSTRSPVSSLPRVLVCFLVQFDLLFAFGVLSC